MNDPNLKIFSKIIANLESADESNCLFRVSGNVAQLAKLTRRHWNHGGKGDLWQLTQNIWQDLRSRLSLHELLNAGHEGVTGAWLTSQDEADFRDLAFLAEVASRLEFTPRLKNAAKRQLEDLLRRCKANRSPAYRAIELSIELLGNRPREAAIEREELSAWEIFEAPADHAPPTLTSRRADFTEDALGMLTVQVDFREILDLHDIVLEVHRGDEDAIFKILDMFDSAKSPREKYACVEALRMIGGCLVAHGCYRSSRNVVFWTLAVPTDLTSGGGWPETG